MQSGAIDFIYKELLENLRAGDFNAVNDLCAANAKTFHTRTPLDQFAFYLASGISTKNERCFEDSHFLLPRIPLPPDDQDTIFTLWYDFATALFDHGFAKHAVRLLEKALPIVGHHVPPGQCVLLEAPMCFLLARCYTKTMPPGPKLNEFFHHYTARARWIFLSYYEDITDPRNSCMRDVMELATCHLLFKEFDALIHLALSPIVVDPAQFLTNILNTQAFLKVRIFEALRHRFDAAASTGDPSGRLETLRPFFNSLVPSLSPLAAVGSSGARATSGGGGGVSFSAPPPIARPHGVAAPFAGAGASSGSLTALLAESDVAAPRAAAPARAAELFHTHPASTVAAALMAFATSDAHS